MDLAKNITLLVKLEAVRFFMPVNIDQAIIPLSHINNYFNLRKSIVASHEISQSPFNQSPAWICSPNILDVARDLEPDTLYQHVGIDISQPYDDTLISARQCMQLVRWIKQVVPIKHLGLVIGKLMTLSHHGQAGIAVMTQDTLENAMKMACQFGELLFPALKYRYKRNQQYCSIEFQENCHIEDLHRFFVEIKIASYYHIFKHLCGPDKEVAFVHFSFSEPSYSHHYKKYFKCPIEFNADVSEVAIPIEYSDQVLSLANRFMASNAQESVFNSVPVSGLNMLPIKLRKIILSSNGVFPSLESAAETLGMSGRTLRRRLSDEGSSYQALLNEVRTQLAKELLHTGEKNITEIAFLLGFGDTSAFTKAFKKWTKMSPSEYKKIMGQIK